MGSTKTILKRATAYVLAFVMAFSMLFTGNNVVTTNAAAAVSKLTVKKSKVTIDLSAKSKIANVKVTVKGSNKKFTVKSSKKSVATVKVSKKNAVITGKKVGTAKITVTTKGKNKKNKKLKKTITVNVINSAEDKQKSDQAAATNAQTVINNLPAPTNVTAADEAKITDARKTYDALTPDQKALVPSEVVTKLTDAEAALKQVVMGITITVNPSATINVGYSAQVTATPIPVTAQTTFTYTSSAPTVANVDAKTGKVLGVSAGTAQITVTAANGVSNTVAVNVTEVPVTGITLNTEKQTIFVGEGTTLTATVLPENATRKALEWNSSNKSVATVVNGVVTAVGKGEATITVTAENGVSAKAVITVSSSSAASANGIEATCSNPLDAKHENLVLVGETATFNLKVTKDGNPVSKKKILLDIQNGYGYWNLYKPLTDYVETDENGNATASVVLKDRGSKPTVIDNIRRDAAFATFDLHAQLEGVSSVSKFIPVTFGQVYPQTESSYNAQTNWGSSEYAVTVENLYDENISSDFEPATFVYQDEAVGKDSVSSTILTNNLRSTNGYKTQFVYDQQVKDDNDSHNIVLDAAPLLIYPNPESKIATGTFNWYNKEGKTWENYPLYCGEDDHILISNIPGGIKNFSIQFNNLKLSKYSRIVVRAYENNTSEPILIDDEERVEEYITADTVLSDLGKEYPLDEKFAAATKNKKKFDLWIFVESVGQVIVEDIEVDIKRASADYETDNSANFAYERLGNIVTWELGETEKQYTVDTPLNSPESYLGDYYDSNMTYTVSFPPYTGNAVITGTQGTTKKYYLYPTIADSTGKVSLRPSGSRWIIECTKDQINDLTSKAVFTQDNGKATINSEYIGHALLTATVKFVQDENNPSEYKYSYKVRSSVEFLNAGGKKIDTYKEFYALTGQRVALTATVTQGPNKANADLVWSGIEGAKIENNNNEPYNSTTDGSATLYISATEPLDLDKISVKLDNENLTNYKVSLSVADQPVKETYASLHWIKPGLYFKADLGDKDTYDTARKQYTKDEEPNITYYANQKWRLGTKVSGLSKNDKIIVDSISNINVDMIPSQGEVNGIAMTTEKVDSGVCTVYSQSIGTSNLRANINGLTDAGIPIIINILDPNTGSIIKNTCVGTGDFTHGGDINIHINWTPEGKQISLVIPNSKYNVHEERPVYAYIVVKDKTGVNPVEGASVKYSIADNDDNKIADDKQATTNSLGIVEVPIPIDKFMVGTFTITAYLTENNTYVPKGTISFTDNEEAFILVDNGVNKSGNTVKLTFTKELDKDFVEKHPEFFEIKNGDVNVDINSISIDKTTDAKTVIITTKQEVNNTTTVNIKDSVTNEQNQISYFTDINGVVYSKAN